MRESDGTHATCEGLLLKMSVYHLNLVKSMVRIGFFFFMAQIHKIYY